MEIRNIPIISEMIAGGNYPEVLFWVGCAGSFDPRAQKVTRAFVQILQSCKISFAILGKEEQCTGDPARRAGNEFIFQMLALQNIQTLNSYDVKRIVTTCPHCFNVIKNDYPALGGDYEVVHHSQFLQSLIDEGRLKIGEGSFQGKKITYHDSCYLGRANDIFEAPRQILEQLDADLVEMERNRRNGLCCGAGGAQMFKEDEPGSKRINIERAEEALSTNSDIIAANCPFCITMLTDGVAAKEKSGEVMVYDLTELIIQSIKNES
ncbi:MAG: (Fe-S)-binding protein [Saprospiraceae bacterium]|nr:(Fe-S)-binding protein [Saprospiraceae bacterium]